VEHEPSGGGGLKGHAITSIDGQIAGQGVAEYGTILPIDRYLDRATGA
jgi:hypothetical protein